MVVSNAPSTSSLKELRGDKTTGKKIKELVADVENLDIINFHDKIKLKIVQQKRSLYLWWHDD